MDNSEHISQHLLAWTPDVIVKLIGEIAWPIAILLIAWRFKDGITAGINNLLTGNKVTEVSIGASGITAKLEASKQEAGSIKPTKEIASLPEGMDAESVRRIQTEKATQYSLELMGGVKNHVDALNISDLEKIEILISEVSLLMAAQNFTYVSSTLFLSQYNLFNKQFYAENIISKEDIENYFQEVKASTPSGFGDWDADKYLEYPLSVNLIEPYENGYRLTKFGMSFIIFTRNNPILLDHMAKL